MDPDYGAYYGRLYKEHWWWRSRERWVLDAVRRCNLNTPNCNILDIGCGDALFFDKLVQFGNVEGLEADGRLVSADNPYRDRIFVGPFDKRFRPGKLYRLILLLDVLEHLPDSQAALSEVASLLDEDGRVLLTVPAFNLLWTNHDVINHHVTRYRKSSLFPLLRAAGLEVLEADYWFQWTFPVKLVQRAMETVLRSHPTNPSIPGPFVNGLLSKWSAAEHALFSRLHIPFGSSLFVVCRRAEPVGTR